ncbi:hypothetical protein [Acinetobacter sp. YH16044]|nr:hypothetical protein [Acinetobacter sp. YH16044]
MTNTKVKDLRELKPCAIGLMTHGAKLPVIEALDESLNYRHF